MKGSRNKRGGIGIESSLAAGVLFAAFVLVMSLTSKFFGVFNGFVGFYLNLFQEFGYDINAFGIVLGTLYGFVTGFVINYSYRWTLSKIYNALF